MVLNKKLKTKGGKAIDTAGTEDDGTKERQNDDCPV